MSRFGANDYFCLCWLKPMVEKIVRSEKKHSAQFECEDQDNITRLWLQ